MARISHSWEEAARHAGIAIQRDATCATPFTDLPAFDQYQAGEIPVEAYLAAISEWAGCSPEEARQLHNLILIEPYPGTEELVEELHARGLATGCLSNTNELHWEELTSPTRFPAISQLQGKMASHLEGMNKPDHRIFQLYADRYSLEPHQIAYFDDNGPNATAAGEVGFQTLRIDPNGDTVAQMRGFLVSLGALEE